jgi:hypothetical protein
MRDIPLFGLFWMQLSITAEDQPRRVEEKVIKILLDFVASEQSEASSAVAGELRYIHASMPPSIAMEISQFVPAASCAIAHVSSGISSGIWHLFAHTTI